MLVWGPLDHDPFVLPLLSLKASLVFVMKNLSELEKCLSYRFFTKSRPSKYTWKFGLTANKMLPRRCPSGFLVVTHLHISNKCTNIFNLFSSVCSVLYYTY